MQALDRPSVHRHVRHLGIAAIASLALVAPFAALEGVTSRGFGGGTPVALFAVMWLLPLTFFLVLIPLVQRGPAFAPGTSPVVSLVWRVAVLALVAWLWFGLVSDQVPCFLGTPNCD